MKYEEIVHIVEVMRKHAVDNRLDISTSVGVSGTYKRYKRSGVEYITIYDEIGLDRLVRVDESREMVSHEYDMDTQCLDDLANLYMGL